MKNRVALVTGAASGIGRATSLRLAARGCRVLGGDPNLAGLEAVVSEARAAGGEVRGSALDVTSRVSVQKYVEAAVDAFGHIDYLVNSAGLWELKPLLEMDDRSWDRLMGVNLKGPMLCCQSVVPHMLRAGSGSIVNVSSIAGRNGGSWCGPHYAASKAGIIGLTQNLAREFGPRRIRVNCVAPGPTQTPMTADWPEDVTSGIFSRSPLGRLAQAEEIADAIIFLLSDESRFITGETLEVNGGLLIH